MHNNRQTFLSGKIACLTTVEKLHHHNHYRYLNRCLNGFSFLCKILGRCVSVDTETCKIVTLIGCDCDLLSIYILMNGTEKFSELIYLH